MRARLLLFLVYFIRYWMWISYFRAPFRILIWLDHFSSLHLIVNYYDEHKTRELKFSLYLSQQRRANDCKNGKHFPKFLNFHVSYASETFFSRFFLPPPSPLPLFLTRSVCRILFSFCSLTYPLNYFVSHHSHRLELTLHISIHALINHWVN